MKTKEKRQTNIIRSSLKTSTIEGSWWAVRYGMVETYFGAFFEILRYTSFEISIFNGEYPTAVDDNYLKSLEDSRKDEVKRKRDQQAS